MHDNCFSKNTELDVMLLTCKKIPQYQICEEIYPVHRIMKNNPVHRTMKNNNKDVMLLTCKKIPQYQICEEIYPVHRIMKNNPVHRSMKNNNKYFIIQKAMFTCLFQGATSNKAELNYTIRHDAPGGESLSFI